MAQLNRKTKSQPVFTHEGGKAKRITPEMELRRTVMACMLWEDQFYEDGASIADRISSLIPKVGPTKCYEIATEARNQMKLRHAPLLIAREMARHFRGESFVSNTIHDIIQRPDELTEFLSIYWKDGKIPLSSQVKKGLAKAALKFNEYSYAKYNRDKEIKLRDVLMLCHAKPYTQEQAQIFGKIINKDHFPTKYKKKDFKPLGKYTPLETPDTWETAITNKVDKKEEWTRLLIENKLGPLALLRNLRNMTQAGVETDLLRDAILDMNIERVLPYRFITAAKYAPRLEPELEQAMFKAIETKELVRGDTALLIDVSGSMEHKISDKSEMTRMDAACALAILAREMFRNVTVFTFSDRIIEVPPRRGFALRDQIINSQPHSGTALGGALNQIHKNFKYDRMIVFTDEQSNDTIPNPLGKGYVINVASFKNGVGYGPWMHIDGFSEAVLDYICQYENLEY